MTRFLLFDLVFVVLGVVFYGASLVPAVFVLDRAHGYFGTIGLAVAVPVAYLVFLTGLVLVVGTVRLVLPRLRPGHFRLPFSKGMLVWLLHLTLQRYINNGLIRDSLFYISTLRTLYLRLMGARVHGSASISGNVNLMDLSLLEVGRGSLIGSGVAIFGHFMVGKVLQLKANRIGENVVLGAYCIVAPGLTVGDDTFIGAGCSIGFKVAIGSGCRIEPASYLPAGTEVPDGETWGGYPACKVGD